MMLRDNQEAKERRATRRIGCRLRLMNDSLGVVTDISEGGARFSFHHAVSLHEDLDVPIKIGDRIIWARVHPLWAQPSPAPQVFDVGGSFSVISEDDREVIRQYVEKNLRKPFGFRARFFSGRSN